MNTKIPRNSRQQHRKGHALNDWSEAAKETSDLFMYCMWLQEWKNGRPYIRGRELRIFFHCITARMMGFAKDVVQLLSTRFQMGSFGSNFVVGFRSEETVFFELNLLKNKYKLNFLFQQSFGSMAVPNKNRIINFSNNTLSNTKEFVLSHGLNFCLPLNNVERTKHFSEFVKQMGQLLHNASFPFLQPGFCSQSRIK